MLPLCQSLFISSKSILSSKGPLKQVILVRMDLKMGVGKIAAQCSHAALKAYKEMNRSDVGRKLTELWETSGQAKVVLKVNDEDHMRSLADEASKLGINVATIRDAGRTQIPSGSMTVCALGPASAEQIDRVTGALKLL